MIMTHAHEKNTRSTAASSIQARSNSNFMILDQLLQLMGRKKQTNNKLSPRQTKIGGDEGVASEPVAGATALPGQLGSKRKRSSRNLDACEPGRNWKPNKQGQETTVFFTLVITT
jgi:hypothetical protein